MWGLFRRTFFPHLLLFTVVSICTGCNSVGEFITTRLTPSPTFVQATHTPLATAIATEGTFECAFVLSNRSLSDLSIQVNDTFKKIGLVEVEAEASAYGEDCLDTETNTVVRFTAMQTDFYFFVSVDNLDDPQLLGEWVERIDSIMQDFLPGKIPGPNPGYFGITFNNGSEKIVLWFPRSQLNDLIDEGVRGSDLFEAIQNP